MSWSAYSPLYPSLTPRPADPLWFAVDRPVDDEAELAKEEAEHAAVSDDKSKMSSELCYFCRHCKKLLGKGLTLHL